MTALHLKGPTYFKFHRTSVFSIQYVSRAFQVPLKVLFFKQENRTKHFCWSAKYACLHISVAVLMISSFVF